MSRPSVPFDPTDPAFVEDPYPAYQLLRQLAPIVWIEQLNMWAICRYADIAAVFRDPRMGVCLGNAKAFKTAPRADPRLEVLVQVTNDQMLFLDPPEHTRLRGLVNKAFTPRVVERLREPMRHQVAGILDRVAAAGRMDLVADLAFPLPVTVIALMLGVPVEDHEQFKHWSQALAQTVEPAPPAEALYAASEAAAEIREYFRTLVARKRSTPREDLLSALIQAEEQGQRLRLDELIANAILLLVAGHETTVNLIGNGVLALLRHPDQLERLRRQPTLIENAVEELLRYDSPVQITSRLALERVNLAGQWIESGEEVMMLLGSANRDEARFPEPDRLDLSRADCKHLSFGGGAHYCVGAPLARVEAQIAIGMLLERFPRIEWIGDQPARKPSAALRGLSELPLMVG